MKTIYIVRHAKAEGQSFQSPLTLEGEEQAHALVEFFNEIPIEKIISSPFTRAVDTIAPTANRKGISIQTDMRLGERVLSEELMSDWKEKLAQTFVDFDLSFPGGESNRSALERATSVIEDVLRGSEEHVVLVSHGNLTTLLLYYFDSRYGVKELFNLSNPDVYQVRIMDSTDKMIVDRIWK